MPTQKPILSKADLDAIKQHIGETLEEQLDGKLEEKLKHLPNREEFYAIMDELMIEVKESRKEQVLLSGRISKLEGYNALIIGKRRCGRARRNDMGGGVHPRPYHFSGIPSRTR